MCGRCTHNKIFSKDYIKAKFSQLVKQPVSLEPPVILTKYGKILDKPSERINCLLYTSRFESPPFQCLQIVTPQLYTSNISANVFGSVPRKSSVHDREDRIGVVDFGLKLAAFAQGSNLNTVILRYLCI